MNGSTQSVRTWLICAVHTPLRLTLTLLCLLLLLVAQSAQGQIEPTSQVPQEPTSDARHVSVFLSVGALEIISAGVLVQFSDEYAAGVASAFYGLNGEGSGSNWPVMARSIGVRGSYYFSRDGYGKFLWANAITVDCLYLLPEKDRRITWDNRGGVGIEAVVGRDGLAGPGLGIIWGVGISMSLPQEYRVLITPAIRLGLHVDI